MPNLTNSEAIAFREDHDRYMAKEVAADKRDNWVENQVIELMREEYNTFKPEHVLEAISELSFADQILLGSYMQSAFNLPDNTTAQLNLSDFILDRVQDYWHACAVVQAQKQYDEGTW